MDKDHLEEMTSSSYHEKGGCVVRHKGFDRNDPCSHGGQGYNITESSRKTMYNAPTAYKPEDIKQKRKYLVWVGSKLKPYKPKSHPKTTIITDLWDVGAHQNFLSGMTHPYLHNWHHMIPNGVLNEELYDEEEYGNRFLKLLMAGKYNINHGRNIILLPKEKWIGETIKLPVHCPGKDRSHRQYSNFVRPQLGKIKKKLKDLLENKTIHEVNQENVGNVAEEVHRISDELLELLRSFEPGSSINRRELLEKFAKDKGLLGY